MSTSTLGLFLRHLALSEEVSRLGTASDHHLLTVYETERGQAVFVELMRRHGPMVLRTCHRVLGGGPDAEDAFQATFIYLARQAGQLRREMTGPLSLGGWLHRVAYRTALKALTSEIRRRTHERQANVMTHPDPDPSAEATWNEVRPILDAELDALPEQARRLLIACYLQGKTHAEAAAELKLPQGSVSRHLERARALLAARLARRGITVSSVLLAMLLEGSAKGAGVPAVLLVHTVEAVRRFTEQSAGALSDNVARLVKGGLAQMSKGSTHLSIAIAGWVGLLGAGLLACQTLKAWPDQHPESESPAAAERPAQEGDTSTRTDRYGDPLPAGALTRLGTVRLRHAAGVHSLAFTRDGKGLITAGEGHPARLWDLATDRLLRQFGDNRDNQVYTAALSPDGRILAGRVAVGGLCLWDVDTGKLLRRLKAEPLETRARRVPLVFSPDGKTLATVDNGTLLRVWKTATGEERWNVNVGNASEPKLPSSLTYSTDGKTLIWGGHKGDLHLYDTATGKELHRWDDKKKHGISTLAAAPDGRLFAAYNSFLIEDGKRRAVKERLVRLWDPTTGKEAWRGEDEKDRRDITAAVFSPDGKILATGCMWGTFRLWDAATGKELRRRAGCPSTIEWLHHSLAFAPEGKTLASADQAVHLWDISSGREIRHADSGHEATVRSVSFTPDGQDIISSSVDGSLRVWDAATGAQRHRFLTAGDETSGPGIPAQPGADKDTQAGMSLPPFINEWIYIHASAVSPDGKTLVSAVCETKQKEYSRSKVYRWDRESGRELSGWVLSEDRNYVKILSPDGKTVACMMFGAGAGMEAHIYLRDAATGKELSGFSPIAGDYPAFSPDGQLLAAISSGFNNNGRSFTLWEIATGKKLCSVEMPEKEHANHLCFSPDGRILATISSKHERGSAPCIYLWPLSREEPVRVGPPRLLAAGLTIFNSHAGLLTFSPDGRTLALPGEGGTIRLLETATGKERARFTGHSGAVETLSFAPDGRRLVSGSCDTTVLVWDVTGHLLDGRLRTLELSAQEIEKLWDDLAASDGRRAGRAIWTLTAAPAQAVPYLRERLRKSAANTHKALAKVPQLLRDLDNDVFAVREEARAELTRLGAAAEPDLRQALEKSPSLEVRRSLEELLKAAEAKHQVLSGEPLRVKRALEVLEHIGTREVRATLKALTADGSETESSLLQEARAALERLEKAVRR